MQFSNIIAILSMALTAVQAAPNPAALNTRTTPDCSVNGSDKKVCCTLLGCVVTLLNNPCSGGSAFCCETNNPVGALVSINLLNCVDFL